MFMYLSRYIICCSVRACSYLHIFTYSIFIGDSLECFLCFEVPYHCNVY